MDSEPLGLFTWVGLRNLVLVVGSSQLGPVGCEVTAVQVRDSTPGRSPAQPAIQRATADSHCNG